MTRTDVAGAFVWEHEPPEPARAEALSAALRCPRWFADLLVQRGIDAPDRADRWLRPMLKHLGDPFALPDAEVAAARLLAALDARQRITLFGDYDVDGLTSVALLHDLLSRAGASVTPFLPLRLEEGYGLSTEALTRCLEETRPDLIVTVDCGTNSVESVRTAQLAGVDVIVTDHHEPGSVTAPALALVNPRRSDDPALHVLAGVGVAFKLAHALLKLARNQGRTEAWVQTDPREFLDLVALGTVADLVPLLHENRILVHHGLKHLNQTRRIGLQALREVAGIKQDIDTYEVGFLLAPRLNASGRLGNARMSLHLLMTSDPVEAAQRAAELDSANRERQQVEKAIVEELKARIGTDRELEHFSIVQAEADWHPGVVGIVASRLVQQFHRPTVVIGMDDLGRAKGSCRSIAGLNLAAALAECGDLLVKHGGHAMAAGLEIEWSQIPAFRQRFEEVCRNHLEGTRMTPRLRLDGWLQLSQINEETLSLINRLRPFGMGHPEPVWGANGLRFADEPRQVGQGHLKARLAADGAECEAIGFGMFPRMPFAEPFDGAFHLRLDTFRGRRSLVMHLKDVRPSL